MVPAVPPPLPPSAIPLSPDAFHGSAQVSEPEATPEERTAAARIMRGLNPNTLVALENGIVIMIEDHNDPDGRMYRLEYRSTQDGRHAAGFCLNNPWNPEGRPNDGISYSSGHVAEDGFLCLGGNSTRSIEASPYDLQHVILRSRYWCTGFSVLKETGVFPNL